MVLTTRGQSALEYLVTYGWAILAIVIIAGVLWYFGIFNPSKYVEEKQCGGGTRFQCLDYRVNTSGALFLVIGNKGGAQLNITATYPSSTGCAPSASLVPAQGNATCTVVNFVPASTSGSSFEQTNLVVQFTDVRTGLPHNDTIFVKGKYE